MVLLPVKLQDHHCEPQCFLDLLVKRSQALLEEAELYDDFRKEMQRFLPVAVTAETVEQPVFWEYLTSLIDEQCGRVSDYITGSSSVPRFRM